MIIEFRHKLVRKFPRLREALMPLWMWYSHVLWLLRNIFSGFRPIEVNAGSEVIVMLPEGHIAEEIWQSGFEKGERDFVTSHLQAGMCVLNIGANSGLYTLMAAKIVGSQGEVHAFEPSTENFNRLKRNVLLNNLNNVKINQLAISDFRGSLAVLADPLHPNLDSHYFVQRISEGAVPSNAIEVMACDTVDNYWRDYCDTHLKKVDMFIIDVEGAELDVFKGAQAIFESSPSLVMMAECTSNLDEVSQLLRSNGFTFFEWDDSASSLKEIKMKRGNIFVMRNK